MNKPIQAKHGLMFTMNVMLIHLLVIPLSLFGANGYDTDEVNRGARKDFVKSQNQYASSNTEPGKTEVISEFADPITITGKVVNESGEGIPGVNVVVKGTTVGTTTDSEGKYTISVDKDDAILTFSFLGYTTQESVVSGKSTIDISLAPDIVALNEVVVVGYGEVKKSDLTGSVVSMNSTQIKQANKIDAFSALQGQVSGAVIQRADNKPGGGFTMRIRGAGTINKNETIEHGGFTPGQNPLFVVDGIFVNDITFLNPNDIERMDVLKDASATAIYGSRGTNGVVIIQTKKGASGKLSVQYDNYFGMKQAYNLPDMFNGPEFLEFAKDAAVGVGYSTGNYTIDRNTATINYRPNELKNIANNKYVDWVDLILKKGFQTNHTLNLSGGKDKTSYGAGISYTKDDGTLKGESFERVNLHGNINSELSKYITVGYNNYLTLSLRNEGSREQLRSAYRLRPLGDAYDSLGKPVFFPQEGETFITNPLFEAENMKIETRTFNYLGNLSLSITPVKNLKFTSNFSPNLGFTRYGEYRGQFSKATSGNKAQTRAEVKNSNQIAYTWDNIINYNLNINENHSLNLTGVYSRYLDRYEDFHTRRSDFATDDYSFYNIEAGAVTNFVQGSFSKQSLESYTGRLNYNFANKYLLTLTGRYDGSSILSKENKWAFFPSAAVAWKINEEKFMSSLDIVSNLKARLSYGETGNTGSGGGLGPLKSQSLFNNSTFTNIGDAPVLTAFLTGLANPDLTWERTKETNFGLDFGILKNRISGALDIYNRNIKGIIFFRNLPGLTGYPGVYDNIGESQNKGIEFSLNTVNIDKGGFKWTTSINFAKNTNKITKLYGDVKNEYFSNPDNNASYTNQVGQPVGSIYTWKFEGIWQSDQEAEALTYGQRPGQVRVRDIDEDGDIDANDRTALGSPNPKWTGGLTSTLTFKGIDFSFMAYTSQGATSYSYFHRSHAWDSEQQNPPRYNGLKTNYWTPTNPSNDWYQPGNPGSYRDALMYMDVSYVKIGYVTLGYLLPTQIIEKLRIGSLRIYATVQNPFVFTKYEGWDPENASRNTFGSSYLSRTYMAGLNVKF